MIPFLPQYFQAINTGKVILSVFKKIYQRWTYPPPNTNYFEHRAMCHHYKMISLLVVVPIYFLSSALHSYHNLITTNKFDNFILIYHISHYFPTPINNNYSVTGLHYGIQQHTRVRLNLIYINGNKVHELKWITTDLLQTNSNHNQRQWTTQ